VGQANGLAMDTIFGGDEGQFCKCAGAKGSIRGHCEEEAVLLVEELGIFQPARLCAMASTSVFARIEKKVEGNGNHVSSGCIDKVIASLGNKGNVEKNSDRNGFNTGNCGKKWAYQFQ